jgi:hypothetical protein
MDADGDQPHQGDAGMVLLVRIGPLLVEKRFPEEKGPFFPLMGSRYRREETGQKGSYKNKERPHISIMAYPPHGGMS